MTAISEAKLKALEVSEKLRKARVSIPQCVFKCKKWCWECCTSIDFSVEEKQRMDLALRNNGYIEPPNWKGKDFCEYLDLEGHCSVYDERPMICRAFWVVRTPFLYCEYNTEEQVANKEAPLDMPQEFMEYMDYMFKTGHYSNKWGQQVKNQMPIEQRMLMNGASEVVPAAKVYLDAYRWWFCNEAQFQEKMWELEKIMMLHNDSLANYFSWMEILVED